MDSSGTIEARIVTVAQGMLSGSVPVVDGCRSLLQLRRRLAKVDEGLFETITAVESETDAVPLGAERNFWTQEALARKDAEVETYVCRVRDSVMEACRNLVQHYSSVRG